MLTQPRMMVKNRNISPRCGLALDHVARARHEQRRGEHDDRGLTGFCAHAPLSVPC